MMESKQEGVEIRHLVDGVWHNGAAMEREVGDPALEALKVLCGMNSQDRANRQEGKFGCEYQVLKQAVFDKIERAKASGTQETLDRGHQGVDRGRRIAESGRVGAEGPGHRRGTDPREVRLHRRAMDASDEIGVGANQIRR